MVSTASVVVFLTDTRARCAGSFRFTAASLAASVSCATTGSVCSLTVSAAFCATRLAGSRDDAKSPTPNAIGPAATGLPWAAAPLPSRTVRGSRLVPSNLRTTFAECFYRLALWHIASGAADHAGAARVCHVEMAWMSGVKHPSRERIVEVGRATRATDPNAAVGGRDPVADLGSRMLGANRNAAQRVSQATSASVGVRKGVSSFT